MGLAALLACVALAVQDPAPAAESADVTVTLPQPLPSRPSADATPPAQDPAKPAAALAIPVDEARRVSKPIEEKAEAGPSIGGFMVGSFAVVGFLGAAFLL